MLLSSLAAFSLSGCYDNSTKELQDTPIEQTKYILTQYDDRSGSQGMFYSIETLSNELIIIDGGQPGNAEQVKKVIDEKGNGKVDAWIITHPHVDHEGAFVELMKNDEGEILVDRIFTVDLPYEDYQPKAHEWDAFSNYVEFMDIISKRDNVSFLSEGDMLKICEIDTLVLHAYSDYVKENSNDLCNDGGVMFKMNFNEESMLFCADVGAIMSNKIIDKYADELDVDYIQMGHHGNGGPSEEFYKMTKPKVAFFDAPEWLFNGETYNTPAKRALMEGMGAKVVWLESAPNVVEIK